MDLCLPKLMQMDRQALYYCTQKLQSSMDGEAGLKVLVGMLRHARSCGMIEQSGLSATGGAGTPTENILIAPQTLNVRHGDFFLNSRGSKADLELDTHSVLFSCFSSFNAQGGSHSCRCASAHIHVGLPV